jgi:hypothetical protein
MGVTVYLAKSAKNWNEDRVGLEIGYVKGNVSGATALISRLHVMYEYSCTRDEDGC